MENLKSPLKTIREHCLDCCNGAYSEVKLCPCKNCKLWPYRFGRNPNRKSNKTLSPEHLDKLKKGRSKKE